MTLTSIGIIGGADGPTAVWVAGPVWPLVAGIAVLVAVVAGLVLYFWKKRRK